MANKAPAPAAKLEPNRILRIGVIQGGRIIEERILRERKRVTIGQAPRNSFIICSASLPVHYEVFSVDGDKYTLKFTSGMDGRVTSGGKVRTLMQVRDSHSAKKVGDWWHLELEPMARGKLVIGDVTLLFQFVQTPPVQPRAQLPVSLRGSVVTSIEPAFTGIMGAAAFLGLLFFAIIQMVDIPKEPSRSKKLRQLVKSQLNKQHKKPPKPMKQDTGEKDDGEGDKAKDKTPKPSDKPAKKPDKSALSKEGPVKKIAKGSDSYKKTLQDLQDFGNLNADDQLKTTAIGRQCQGDECKTAVAGNPNALARGGSFGNLDEKARQSGGVGIGGPSGGRSGKRRGIRGRGGSGVRVGTAGMGPGMIVMRAMMRVVKIMGRVTPISLPKPSLGGGAGAKVRSKIRRKVYGLRSCYNRALINNASLRGTVRISFTIMPNGRVSGVNIRTGMGGGVGSCVRGRVARWFLGKVPNSVFYAFTVNFKPGG